MELIDKYKKEIEADVEISSLNLRDIQMRLPGIKHKWAARIINHKIERDKIESLIPIAKNTIIQKCNANSAVTLSTPTLEKHAELNETVIKLRNKLKEEGYVIMYLEKIEKILSSTTFDIKNLVEILKLEQL